MSKLKIYNWALDGLAALVLLVGSVLMVIAGTTKVSEIVVMLVGIGILFFTLIRIKPILASRNEKDYVLIMFAEMIISLIVGIVFVFFYKNLDDNSIITFSRLSGLVLFIRGIIHFYTTSKRYELHDMVSFIAHILFISFGFLFLWENNLIDDEIATGLMVLSFLLTIFFGYRTYSGYNRYRILKTNELKINDYLDKKQDKENVIEDPLTIEEKINPKKIDEPKSQQPTTIIDEPKDEDRPSVEIN